MANRKKKQKKSGSTHPQHFGESSPNPHGENKIIEMPIRTHQGHDTAGQNVAQTTSTIDGDLNPSVAHDEPTKRAKNAGSPQPDTAESKLPARRARENK
ncbi:MAG TPA: hypothetical protein VFB76_20135 [Candidatus Angelobacter sp.]|nr:hypothetical protein [Candidatus Angelobacter sp.]